MELSKETRERVEGVLNSVRAKAARIGQEATATLGTGSAWCHVRVRVLDYKPAYGRDRWTVEPINGNGAITLEAVTFDTE